MHWLPVFWFHYLVPSMWGNGPEAAAQTVLYGIIALILIPPFRKFLGKHIVEPLKTHLTAEHKKLHDKLDDLHIKIDAVHTHLGINAPAVTVTPPAKKAATHKATPAKRPAAKPTPRKAKP
jgi:hypothetical protein